MPAKEFLFYKDVVQPSTLPKINYLTGTFHGSCLPSRNSFSKEHLSVAASQYFIIHGKTAIFKTLVVEYSFHREYS